MKKYTIIETLPTSADFRFPNLDEEKLKKMLDYLHTNFPEAKIEVVEESKDAERPFHEKMRQQEKIEEIKKRAEKIYPEVVRDGVLLQVQILEDTIVDYSARRSDWPFLRGFIFSSVVNINTLTRLVLGMEMWIDAGLLLDELDEERKAVKEE